MISLPNPVAKLLMSDFPSIRITRTVEYSPELYLEFCKENGTEPNKDEFLWFLEDSIDEDFANAFPNQNIEFIYD